MSYWRWDLGTCKDEYRLLLHHYYWLRINCIPRDVRSTQWRMKETHLLSYWWIHNHCLNQLDRIFLFNVTVASFEILCANFQLYHVLVQMRMLLKMNLMEALLRPLPAHRLILNSWLYEKVCNFSNFSVKITRR